MPTTGQVVPIDCPMCKRQLPTAAWKRADDDSSGRAVWTATCACGAPFKEVEGGTTIEYDADAGRAPRR